MYERFHSLRERPFSLSPDPDYLYPSRIHSEALSYLRYGIEGHAGFIVITGEIGSGKTTLLQTALRGIDKQTSVSRLVNTLLDARELIEAVMLDFGLEARSDQSKPRLLRDLAKFLVEQRSAGRLSLLVIDEAQNLGMAALEEVRMLSNLETEKSKLIQIALVGQPSLRDKLGRPELQQLRQRVGVSYHLRELDADGTAAYIRHRLRRASIGAPVEFSRTVSDLVHEHSEGLPRKINIIADAILLFAYGEGRHDIAPDLAREAIGELEATGVIAKVPGGARAAAPAPSSSLSDRGISSSRSSAAVPAGSDQTWWQDVGPTPAAQVVEPERALDEPEPAPDRRQEFTSRAVNEGAALSGMMRSASVPASRTASPPVQERIVMPPLFLLHGDHPAGAPGFWARLRRTLFSSAPLFED